MDEQMMMQMMQGNQDAAGGSEEPFTAMAANNAGQEKRGRQAVETKEMFDQMQGKGRGGLMPADPTMNNEATAAAIAGQIQEGQMAMNALAEQGRVEEAQAIDQQIQKKVMEMPGELKAEVFAILQPPEPEGMGQMQGGLGGAIGMPQEVMV